MERNNVVAVIAWNEHPTEGGVVGARVLSRDKTPGIVKILENEHEIVKAWKFNPSELKRLVEEKARKKNVIILHKIDWKKTNYGIVERLRRMELSKEGAFEEIRGLKYSSDVAEEIRGNYGADVCFNIHCISMILQGGNWYALSEKGGKSKSIEIFANTESMHRSAEAYNKKTDAIVGLREVLGEKRKNGSLTNEEYSRMQDILRREYHHDVYKNRLKNTLDYSVNMATDNNIADYIRKTICDIKEKKKL